MKSKLSTIPLLFSLTLLSACVQELNTTQQPSPLPTPAKPTSIPSPLPTPTPEHISFATPSAVSSIFPDATATPTPSPIPTPLTQVEVEDITPKPLEGLAFHALAVSPLKDNPMLFIGTYKDKRNIIAQFDIKSLQLKEFPIHAGSLSNRDPHQIAANAAKIMLTTRNCLHQLLLETGELEEYSCHTQSKKIQEVLISKQNRLYTFGEFIPQYILDNASSRFLYPGSSSAYHATQNNRTLEEKTLFSTQPVGGPYLIEHMALNAERISWGISIPINYIWQGGVALWRNVNHSDIHYRPLISDTKPFISVFSLSSKQDLPPGLSDKMPYIQDGPVAQATFWQPNHFVVDHQQSVYFIDHIGDGLSENESYIRRVSQGIVKSLIAIKGLKDWGYPHTDLAINQLFHKESEPRYSKFESIAIDQNSENLYLLTTPGKLYRFALRDNRLSFLQELPMLANSELKDLTVGPNGDLYVTNTKRVFHIRIPEHLKKPTAEQP